MTTNTHNGRWSQRLGRGAGRAWRGYLRREQRVASWLVTRGVPAGAATVVLWIAKLAVLGMLLYTVCSSFNRRTEPGAPDSGAQERWLRCHLYG